MESPPKGHTKSAIKLNAQKSHMKMGMNSIIESWVDSNQDSEIFFWVVSWFESKFRKFFSHKSIWFKFQKSILNRELVRTKSCKATVIHELSRIKTFWDWVESNQFFSESYPYLLKRDSWAKSRKSPYPNIILKNCLAFWKFQNSLKRAWKYISSGFSPFC